MKKIILSALIGLASTASFAQKKISEGTITYTAEWQVPPEMQQMAANLPKELTIYFKGDSSATTTKSAFFSNKTVVNTKTEYYRLLIDIPMQNKKYSVILTPDDVEQMQENGPQFTTTATSETKTLNGYKAQKYTITEKKSGKTSDAYFTKDLTVTPNSLTVYFDKSLGFPLDFVTTANRMMLKATVKDIKEESVPAGTFGASKDYEEITLAQLMGMFNGGRR